MTFAREELTEAERRVQDHFEAGEIADLGREEGAAPSEGAGWGAERTVRAEVIAQLLTGEPESELLVLIGARIINTLDFTGLELASRLQFAGCWFDSPVLFSGARLPMLGLIACVFPALHADGLSVGTLTLEDSRCGSEVILANAHVGELDNASAAIPSGDRFALNAQRLRVDGYMNCDGLIVNGAQGAVSLTGASLDGSLSFVRAKLTSSDGVALDAHQLRIDGVMDCSRLAADGAVGAVILSGASLDGSLSFVRAKLTSSDGAALFVYELHVSGIMDCSGLTADGARGAVILLGANINGLLSFAQAKLTSGNGTALSAERLNVGGDLSLESLTARPQIHLPGLQAQGSLSVDGAVVVTAKGGSLDLDATQLKALLSPKPSETVDEFKPTGVNRFRFMGARATDILPVLPLALIVALVILLTQVGIHLQSGSTIVGETAKIVWFSFFTGLCSMVIIEVAKRLLALRGIYQGRQVRVWLTNRATNEVEGQLAYDRLTNILGSQPENADLPNRYRGFVRQRQLRRLFDLPIEQFSAQIRIAADAVIMNSLQDRSLLSCFAGRPIVLSLEKDALGLEGRAYDDVEVVQLINGAIDAFQVSVGEGWRRYLRTAAMIISGLLGFAFLKFIPGNHISIGLYILASLSLGGFFAWFLRDLTAIVEKLRR